MRYLVSIAILFLLAAIVEAGPHKQKKVKCKDKKFTNCYKKDLFCPVTCPRDCVVDCVSCQPSCIAPPPPPPFSPPPPPKSKKRSPPPPRNPPPPHTYRLSPPYHWPFDSPPPPPVIVPGNPNPPPPPASEVLGQKRYCRNKSYPQCYRMEQTCPSACPNSCEVDCVTCRPICDCNKPGAVCQDPRFIGADGITFYFHGKKDQEFCIVSDSNLHINAHFIGKRNQTMKRDFTWVQTLGILFDNHQISIGAKKTSTWDNSIDRLDLTFDKKSINIPEIEGSKWESSSAPGVSITRSRDTNAVTVEVDGNFQIKATVVPITEKESKIHNYGINEEDCFAHLDMSFKFYSLSGDVNGVLGQTYASKYVSRVKMGVDVPVLGGDKEFSSSSLFSTDCAVARFSGINSIAASKSVVGVADLNCASGLDGRGVVCKR